MFRNMPKLLYCSLFSFLLIAFAIPVITIDDFSNNGLTLISEELIPINYTGYILNRSTLDRPDDSEQDQIHIIYVIPSDKDDEELDINGKIATSVTAFQRWFLRKTIDRALRMDTYNGSLDISFWKLERNDSEMMSHGAFVVTEIEKELKNNGLFNKTNKKYAIYYGGGSTYACGGAAWPPYVLGQYAAMYLKAYPTGYQLPCSKNSLTSSIDNPKYWEYAMLHDLFHTLGAVSPEAPHYTETYPAHVTEDPKDLMYSGTASWNPSIIDLGNDDYYGHNRSDSVDIKKSSYLQFFNYTPGTVENSSSSTSNGLSTITTESNVNTTTSKLNLKFATLEVVFFLFILNGRRKLKKNNK